MMFFYLFLFTLPLGGLKSVVVFVFFWVYPCRHILMSTQCQCDIIHGCYLIWAKALHGWLHFGERLNKSVSLDNMAGFYFWHNMFDEMKQKKSTNEFILSLQMLMFLTPQSTVQKIYIVPAAGPLECIYFSSNGENCHKILSSFIIYIPFIALILHLNEGCYI